MKSITYRIHGCVGSFREVKVSEHSTIKFAREEATRRNQEIADRRGQTLRAYYADRSNLEGSYGAKKA